MRPSIVHSLQPILSDFPGWEIVVVVVIEQHIEDWPAMGLYIRPDVIIDNMRRDLIPKPYRDFNCAGSIPGNGE
ncbi:hypothetical protein X566_15060 [Afipia sp. P52-10]|nr:hypothetical protein X566_15060 [Afipia sp. P52-10]